MTTSENRVLGIDDLAHVEFLSAPEVAPDGREVAFVLNVADVLTGEFMPRVFTVASDGAVPAVVSGFPGEWAESPKYHPQGRELALIAHTKVGHQVWTMNRTTGEWRQLTSLRNGVDAFVWSPDGSSIAFTARLWPEDMPHAFDAMTNDDRRARDLRRKDSPVVIEELVYKYDSSFGIFDGSIRQIGTVNPGTGEQVVLTEGSIQLDKPAWAPDGRRLAFFGWPFPHARALRPAIFTVSIDTGDLVQVTDEDTLVIANSPVAFFPDGERILYAGYRDYGNGVHVGAPFVRPLSGGDSRCLFDSEPEAYGLGPSSTGGLDFGDMGPAFCISGEDESIWFIASHDGTDCVYRTGPNGEKVSRITPAAGCVHAFCAPVGGEIVYTRGDPETIPDLFALDLSSGTERRLTVSNGWLDEISLSPAHELRMPAEPVENGRPSIHGFVIPPPGDRADGLHPVILYVHGGPEVSYGRDFWFEFQYLAARGFVVVVCDPRGSGGYGTAFQSGDVAFGSESMDDLIAFLEYAASCHENIDLDSAGVTGGSYGGLMTNRLIGHTDRFRAAVTQRTLCTLATSYGTGDIGFVRHDPGFSTMLKMLTGRARSRSTTVALVDNISTPLLILHGTDDYRCSFEQAEQLFVAMKERRPDVPVRLIAFPGANHDITRSGRLQHRMAHLLVIADWFTKYLVEQGDDGEG